MPLCESIRNACIHQNQSCAALLTVLNSMHGIRIPGLDVEISRKKSVSCPQTLFPSPTYTCYIIHNLYSFTVSTVRTICLVFCPPHLPSKHSTSGGSRKTWRAVWDIRPVTGRGASMAARSWHAITSESRESNEYQVDP